jgi:hypothetical protein
MREYYVMVVSNGTVINQKWVRAMGWVIEDRLFILRDEADRTVFAAAVSMVVINETRDPEEEPARKLNLRNHDRL